MEDSNNSKEIFTKKIAAGSRNYFFDVRKSSENNMYLTITESKYQHNGEKPERFRILIYEDKLKDFLAGLRESIDFIKDEMLQC